MASLNKILRHFADLDVTRVGIGYGLMVSMVAAVELWWTDTGFPDSPDSGSVTLTGLRTGEDSLFDLTMTNLVRMTCLIWIM